MSQEYKEIEVWVTKDILENGSSIPNIMKYAKYNSHGVRMNGKETIKCILKIPVEEKKVEITESMLEEAFKGAKEQYRDVSDQLWHMKKLIFGDKD